LVSGGVLQVLAPGMVGRWHAAKADTHLSLQLLLLLPGTIWATLAQERSP
jgi:hypothetical protein